MARLTAAHRRAVPADKFAGPNRSFPLTDKTHDRAALTDVGRAERAGSITSGEAKRIRRRAREALNRGG